MKGLIFTYGMTYGGALVALFNPLIGLLVYIAFAIINPEALWSWSVPQGGHYSRIVAIATLMGWAARGCGNWQFGRARWIVLMFIGFFVWGTLSGQLAATRTTLGYMFTVEMAKVLIPFLVGMTIIDSPKKLEWLAWTLVLSIGFLAFEINLQYLQGFNRLHAVGIAGGDNNSAATRIATGVGIALFLGLTSKSTWQRMLGLGCALLMAHAVLLSFSRGAMLATAMAAPVAFFVMPKSPRHYAVFLAAVLVVLRLAGPQVREEFSSVFVESEVRDASAQSRVDLWADCLQVMKERPIFGIGPHHWRLIAHRFGWPEGKSAHSTWFEIGAETGFPGVGFLLAFYATCLYQAWRVVREARGDTGPAPAAARMALVALTAYLVAVSFVSSWGVELGYYVGLLAACSVRLHQAEAAVPSVALCAAWPLPRSAEFTCT